MSTLQLEVYQPIDSIAAIQQENQLDDETSSTASSSDTIQSLTESIESRKQQLLSLYPFQLFYLLPSFESASIVLSYYGYSGQVATLMQKLTRRSRTYYKSDHKHSLKGFL